LVMNIQNSKMFFHVSSRELTRPKFHVWCVDIHKLDPRWNNGTTHPIFFLCNVWQGPSAVKTIHYTGSRNFSW
jgi:hypothetical protein